MVTRTREIDFSTFPDSDGEPMAETFENQIQMTELIFALENLFDLQGRSRIAVGGNQFIYYNPHNGRENVSPDVYVAFDVACEITPPKWQTWVWGKFPDVVWEITSSSTHDEDLGRKRELYARLGAQEYYIFDPQGDMWPPFLGYALRDGQMEPVSPLPGGGIMSPLLRTELRPVALAATRRRPAGTWLRVIDPRNGQPLPVAEEEHYDLQAAREQLAEASQARLTAERRAQAEEQARLMAERRVRAEEQARLMAEERAAEAEATLQALLADLARRQDSGGTPEQE